MTPQCHGEWLLWRAAEGLPYPEDGNHAAAAEELAEEYSEDATPTQPERADASGEPKPIDPITLG